MFLSPDFFNGIGVNMFTKIDLCSMALLKIGEKPIQSLQENTSAAQLARTLFNPIVDTLLSVFPWGFATKVLSLTKNSDGDFIIPSNVLRVIKCPGVISGNKINADADTIDIVAILHVDTDCFPNYFATLVATKLAVEFSIPLTGDTNIFKMMSALYESEFQSAKFIDSANQSSIDNFALINSRF